MSDNLRHIAEKMIHDAAEGIEFLSVAEFCEDRGVVSDLDIEEVDELIHTARIQVYWETR